MQEDEDHTLLPDSRAGGRHSELPRGQESLPRGQESLPGEQEKLPRWQKTSLAGRKSSLEDLLAGDRDPRDGTHPNSVYSKIDLHHKKEKQTGELKIFYQTGVSH